MHCTGTVIAGFVSDKKFQYRKGLLYDKNHSGPAINVNTSVGREASHARIPKVA